MTPSKTKGKNIDHLRDMLFKQLDQLVDMDKPVDLDRARVVCDTSRLLIEMSKVEVEYARVIQGAITLPFIEHQDGSEERPHPSLPSASAGDASNTSAEDRTLQALKSGPPDNHPWRGAGSRIHRLDH
ncbi:hypothetical protein G7048_03635 [Diaphorobacter sp. HDW4B]|uniref:hypothetical protein n=1 Tax=Diaphorobacter sp. HDW4B TaxID=2714925 RepID=UPI00140B7271|nr:hypothetical protein [Diaphorobacter sp. HDW4B]QIL69543.1 hypothetical protein G7048_03635 [Diaphorobacter sp. HDW4B]